MEKCGIFIFISLFICVFSASSSEKDQDEELHNLIDKLQTAEDETASKILCLLMKGHASKCIAGVVSQSRPWMATFRTMLTDVVNFVYFFFQSLFQPGGGNSNTSNYTRNDRRPPRPPARRFGGFGSNNSPPAPPCGAGG